MSERPSVSAHFRLQYEEAQKSWVLLYPEGMVKLNGSAGEIMQRLDGKRSVAEVVGQLEAQFGAQDLAADVLDFLAIAERQRWIER